MHSSRQATWFSDTPSANRKLEESHRPTDEHPCPYKLCYCIKIYNELINYLTQGDEQMNQQENCKPTEIWPILHVSCIG